MGSPNASSEPAIKPVEDQEAPAGGDTPPNALNVVPASPNKQKAPYQSLSSDSDVFQDRANRFDLLKLPRELRDMVYLAWLDITDQTEDETAGNEDGGDFLHECRGYYVPFRTYLKFHADSTKGSLELMPSLCEFFSSFGSQVRQETMHFIFRDHLLLDLKAKNCLRAMVKWVKAFPLCALAL
jgi:hypothetical protein